MLVVLIVVIAWGVGQFLPPPAPPDFPPDLRLRRAAWLGVTWSMDARADAEIEALARELQANNVTEIYVYVSYLKPEGFFNPTFDHAAAFTEAMGEFAPEIRVLGWVGVPIQLAGNAGQINRLEDESVRSQIADFARRVVVEMGFEGVHLNAELIPNDDPAYLQTLDAVRAALPNDAWFSIAPHALRLTEPVTAIPYPTLDHHTSPAYLRAMASRVDEVVVMLYDSGLFFPTDYRAWMAGQVEGVLDTLRESPADILLGLPVSEEWTPSHHVGIESLANALYGLRVGLSRPPAAGALDGVALYPHWEITAGEWAQLAALP